jgi:hypothetical protein
MPHATIPPRLRGASILPALRVQTLPPLPKPPSTIPCSLPRWPLAFPLRASPLFHYAFALNSGGSVPVQNETGRSRRPACLRGRVGGRRQVRSLGCLTAAENPQRAGAEGQQQRARDHRGGLPNRRACHFRGGAEAPRAATPSSLGRVHIYASIPRVYVENQGCGCHNSEGRRAEEAGPQDYGMGQSRKWKAEGRVQRSVVRNQKSEVRERKTEKGPIHRS